MRRLKITITPEVVAGMFTNGERHYNITKGLPVDAMFCDARTNGWDLELLFQVLDGVEGQGVEIVTPTFKKIKKIISSGYQKGAYPHEQQG